MAVSVTQRFNCFKRDDFTCQYCGRKTPAVILECDHVIPVSKDGSDEIENLVTSCFDCNRGKGAVPIGQLPETVDVHDRAVALAERERQLSEYNEIRRKRAEREDSETKWLLQKWNGMFTGGAPGAATLRRYLQSLSVYDISDAMDSTWDRSEAGYVVDPLRYFCGTLKRKVDA